MHRIALLFVALAGSKGPATPSVKEPLVAFSCRFYYPGHAKRSVHQIYISDLHGGHRRQLTFDLSEKTQVRWVGKHALAWVKTKGISKHETELGYHMPEHVPGQLEANNLVLNDLTTGRKRVVAHGKFGMTSFRPDVTSSRGKPTFCDMGHASKASTGYRFPNTYVYFSGFKIKRENDPSLQDFAALGMDSGTDEFTTKGKGFSLKLDSRPQATADMFQYSRQGGVTMSQGAVYWSYHGHKVKVPQIVDCTWDSPDHSKCWFEVGSYAGSAGCDQWIYEIDWKSETCVLVADTVLDIDFDPTSRYWAASSNNKNGVDLGKLIVWARDLWCGDRITKKQWRIASGAVHGDSISVQP